MINVTGCTLKLAIPNFFRELVWLPHAAEQSGNTCMHVDCIVTILCCVAGSPLYGWSLVLLLLFNIQLCLVTPLICGSFLGVPSWFIRSGCVTSVYSMCSVHFVVMASHV